MTFSVAGFAVLFLVESQENRKPSGHLWSAFFCEAEAVFGSTCSAQYYILKGFYQRIDNVKVNSQGGLLLSKLHTMVMT